MWSGGGVDGTGTAAPQHLIGKRGECSGAPFDYRLALEAGRNGVCFDTVATGGVISAACSSGGDGDLPLGTWTHVAGTFDGTMLRLYLDGVEAGAAAGTLGPPSTASLRIGTSGTCGAGGLDFGGMVDDARIYPVALTQAQVETIVMAGSDAWCP